MGIWSILWSKYSSKCVCVMQEGSMCYSSTCLSQHTHTHTQTHTVTHTVTHARTHAHTHTHTHTHTPQWEVSGAERFKSSDDLRREWPREFDSVDGIMGSNMDIASLVGDKEEQLLLKQLVEAHHITLP